MARHTPVARLLTILLAVLPGLVLGLVGAPTAGAAPPPAPASARAPAPGTVDPAAFDQLSWRNVGPINGGRSIAVGGSVQRPDEYYFGATGGGGWENPH